MKLYSPYELAIGIHLKRFNPGQARDAYGKWTSGRGGVARETTPTSVPGVRPPEDAKALNHLTKGLVGYLPRLSEVPDGYLPKTIEGYLEDDRVRSAVKAEIVDRLTAHLEKDPQAVASHAKAYAGNPELDEPPRSLRDVTDSVVGTWSFQSQGTSGSLRLQDAAAKELGLRSDGVVAVRAATPEHVLSVVDGTPTKAEFHRRVVRSIYDETQRQLKADVLTK